MARELQHPTSKEEEKAQETAEKAEKMTMGRCGWGGLSYTRNLEQQRFWSLRKKFPPSKSTPTIGTFFLKSSPLTEIDSTQNELKEQLQRCEGKVSKMSLEAFFGKELWSQNQITRKETSKAKKSWFLAWALLAQVSVSSAFSNDNLTTKGWLDGCCKKPHWAQYGGGSLYLTSGQSDWQKDRHRVIGKKFMRLLLPT